MPHLEGSFVYAVCVVVKQIRFARELHPHRLRRRVVPLSCSRCRRMLTAVNLIVYGGDSHKNHKKSSRTRSMCFGVLYGVLVLLAPD